MGRLPCLVLGGVGRGGAALCGAVGGSWGGRRLRWRASPGPELGPSLSLIVTLKGMRSRWRFGTRVWWGAGGVVGDGGVCFAGLLTVRGFNGEERAAAMGG
jgi:hypothetical protein